MPYFYDFDAAYEALDDDFDGDIPDPRIEDFEYVTPDQFAGCSNPASFTEPRGPVSDAEALRNAKTKTPKVGFLMKLLMWWFIDRETKQRGLEERAKHARRSMNLFASLGPALREIGGTAVHCEYDGGNDEGFAWFKSLQTGQGSKDQDTVVADLIATGLVGKLREADSGFAVEGQPDNVIIENVLEEAVYEWASLILGGGFGGGPVQFYGAFTVDLMNCTVLDDPEASVPADGNCVYREQDQ